MLVGHVYDVYDDDDDGDDDDEMELQMKFAVLGLDVHP
jgi:hypothetical protein